MFKRQTALLLFTQLIIPWDSPLWQKGYIDNNTGVQDFSEDEVDATLYVSD